MYIKDWMTEKVFTVNYNDSVVYAVRLMRDKNIKHLPMMKDGKVAGVVSDRKLKEFLPSKGTSLDVYEINYLLENTKVQEIVRGEVITAPPSLPVEEAALLMLEKNIGSLPVIDGGKLVGIISDKDIFKAMIDITGARNKGYRITFTLMDIPGTIREAATLIRESGFGVESILSGHIGLKDKRRVVIRSRGEGDGKKLEKLVKEKYPDAEILARN